MMTRSSLWAVTAAVLFTAVGVSGSYDDYFLIKTEVGKLKTRRGRVRLDGVSILNVPGNASGPDCVLTFSPSEWKCANIRGDTCDGNKEAIAIIPTEFPYEAKMVFYRPSTKKSKANVEYEYGEAQPTIKPEGTAVSICAGAGVSVKKRIGGAVDFIFGEGDGKRFNVMRIKMGKTLGMIDPSNIPEYSIPLQFEEFHKTPTCFGCGHKKSDKVVKQRMVSVSPSPVDPLPHYVLGPKTGFILVKYGEGRNSLSGGLCVSVLPFNGNDDFEFYNVRITRVKLGEKVPRTCAAIINARENGMLEKPPLGAPRFVFPANKKGSWAVWKLKDGLLGKKITPTKEEFD